jgi:hypothetical protein
MKKKSIICFIFACLYLFQINANEKTGSTIDDYYTSLSLNGSIERPALGYRAFSTNNWNTENVDHPWASSVSDSIFLDNDLFSISLNTLDWFQSYNMNSPHGANDGGLWQGKGYNSALSGGVTFNSTYLDITFYPELYFSQNLEFDIQPASSWSGSEYGYPYSGIDNPQRFGDESFSSFSWGQSQIRFNYENWTLGFGTENFWIGPAEHISIIQSNNADGYPHIDVGLNKTATPWGDMEFRLWWGALKSSSYLDSIESDAYLDYLGGVTFSWDLIFIPGLTLGFHKTTQSELDDLTFYSFIAPIDLGILQEFDGGVDGGNDGTDGRASVTWSWVFPSAGFEFYGEFAMEDYIVSLVYLQRRPEHATGFVLGMRQNIPIKSHKDRYFLLNAEFSSLVWSLDYYVNSVGYGGGFYRHTLTNLGYTNEGQVLGASYGSGGNAQYLSLDYYAPFGMLGVYMNRTKWDNTAMYSPSNINNTNSDWDVPVQMAYGCKTSYFLTRNWSLGADLAFIYDINLAMEDGNVYNGLYGALQVSYRY